MAPMGFLSPLLSFPAFLSRFFKPTFPADRAVPIAALPRHFAPGAGRVLAARDGSDPGPAWSGFPRDKTGTLSGSEERGFQG